jgi:Cu-processing system ATP-binding protein
VTKQSQILENEAMYKNKNNKDLIPVSAPSNDAVIAEEMPNNIKVDRLPSTSLRTGSAQLLAIKNLKKSFGKNLVLKGIDLELEKGAVVAIMGPNGSGKTTLLKSILGLVKPDSGDIYVKDIHLNGNSEYRRYIGYMPQNSCFPENLRVKEVFAMLKDIWGNHTEYDEELMNKLNIREFENKQIGTLSGGTKQRVSSAAAFLFGQEIIILDEPTAGLDPVAAEIVKQKIIDEKNKGKLVIITSHVISEVEELADRIVFMLEGNIHVDSTVGELIAKTNEVNLNRAIAKIMIDFDEGGLR